MSKITWKSGTFEYPIPAVMVSCGSMEKSNIINIRRIVGEDIDHKIYRLLDFSDNPRDIADPWYTGNFDITFNDVIEGCNGFLDYLKNKKEI